MAQNKLIMTPKLAEKIALFKFGIIAPVLNNPDFEHARYFKNIAQQIHDVPGYGRKKYQWQTFKSWLRTYRLKGFDGLKPQTRTDKGQSRIIDNCLHQAIAEKLAQFPGIKIPLLHQMLSADGLIMAGSPCENTLRNYVNIQNLNKPAVQTPKARKKFEKPFVNDLWLSDFMHGDSFIIDGKKTKLYLCGIIDDHSRMMVGCGWSLREKTEALERVFKDALVTYGLPKAFYCDNGSVYVSHHLQIVCARLEIVLIHSKPYDSPSRGKIERFWRTVRDGFLPLVSPQENYTLESFNHLFADWLNHHYHHSIHRGIAQMPLKRYLEGIKKTTIRRISQNEIDLLFYHTYVRTVKNDATVSVNSVLFEVPPKYIGTKVELRHPTGQPFDLWLYENEQPQIKLHKVNPVENSQSPFSGIRFADVKKTENPNNEEDSAC